jgi:hypothetical protein
MNLERAENAARPWFAASALLPEVSRSERFGQIPSCFDQDGLMPLDVSSCETIKRRCNEQRTHQAADLVENRHGKTSRTFNVLGKREIHAGLPGSVDPFNQLVSVEHRPGRDPSKIGCPQESLSPVGGLESDKYDAEGAVQWNFTRKRLDDLRFLRAIAPIDNDRLVSLQHRKTTVFAGYSRQPFDMRMGNLQKTSKRIERRSQWKKPCPELVLTIVKALENSVLDQRPKDSGYRWNGHPDALAYGPHRDGGTLCDGSYNPHGFVDDLDRHQRGSEDGS